MRRAPGARVGDFCLSVAIRTLTLGAERAGLRPARLGIGAGIVHDSRADDEFEECRLKARFLTGLDPGFELFETMRARSAREGVPAPRAAPGAARAQRARLGFAFDRDAACALRAALRGAGAGSRVAPAAGACARRAASPHARAAGAAAGGAVELLIAAQPAARRAIRWPRHKTTLRAHYDAGVRAAEQAGAFDSLFFTADGRLVEGGRSNVFVRWTAAGGRRRSPTARCPA